ncbi:uncharacterized protein MAM_05914 [Metarhizium album ARSEF 1941]|uniref:Septum formation initiator domain-containing protein n=1 Tax=Metarhizium album (strain ARSEF 1941) TaxID=1081103 RepID=A0A0B2WQN7_METAS|nr:uncharacterized protein MAM_05914 [Metarhizium album ARSEF 1941]KHN96328.1 hypothetical protein MAM_05914 [Metarhizium album ARSEF 1941]
MTSTVDHGLDAPNRPSTPQRSGRHQIKRSMTELPSPRKLHLHRHPYLYRRQGSQYEEEDQPPLPSTILAAQVRHSVDLPLPLSAATKPYMSLNPSRRASMLAPRETGEGDAEGKRQPRGPKTQLEHDKASIRTESLKQSLMDLNSLSTTMTKRLDDTYYSVLEKMSTLQHTVLALKDLAESSRDLCESFDKDARELENDIICQLGAAGHFEEQQRRISTLQNRIQEGRDKIQALASRVEVVQARVESWEQADRRWQEKTRKRLKIIWSVTTVLALIIIAFMVGMNYANVGGQSGRWGNSSMSPNIPPWLTTLSSHHGESTQESGRRLLWKAPVRDQEGLRAFDDL